MAKRKRINKPVLIILIVLGSLTAMAGAFFGYGFVRYGTKFPSRMMNWLFPKDPLALERQGDAAYEKKEWAGAADAYGDAAKAASNHGPDVQKRIYFKRGRAMIKYAQQKNSLTDSERREQFTDGFRWVSKASTVDPSYVEPLRLLAELEWGRVMRSLRQHQDDKVATEKLPASLERYVELAGQLIEAETKKVQQERGQAEKDRKLKEFAKSQEHLRDLEELQQAYFRRGVAHTQLYEAVKGDHDKQALSDLRQAVDRMPREGRYWTTLVDFLTSLGQEAEAHKVLKEGLEKNPNDVSLTIRQAEITWRDGKRDKAIADLRRLAESQTTEADGFLALAELLIVSDKMDQAVTVLTTARQKIPDDPRSAVKLAQVRIRLGQTEQALALMRSQRAELIKAGATPGPVVTQRRRADALWQLTHLLASTLLDQAQRHQAHRAERLAEARTLAKAIEEMRPGSAEGLSITGRLAMFDGQWDKATDHLQKAWDIFQRRRHPDLRTALLLASVLIRQNRPLEAERVVDHVLRQPGQGRNVRFLIAKAQIRMKLTDYDSARDLIGRALRAEPKNSEALALKSTLDTLGGKRAELPAKITNPRMIVRQLRDHADTLWFEGRRDEAVALIEELHSRLPDQLSVTAYLADMYLTQGKSDQARALLAEAVRTHPDEEALAFRLKLVEQQTPEDRLALRRQRAAKMTDPYRRELELAGIAQIENRPAKHMQHLLAALAEKTESPLAHYVLRRAVALRRWPDAEKCVELAAKANVDGQNGRLLRARLALVRGKVADAAKLLQDVPTALGKHPEALTLYGQCLLAQGKVPAAEKSFQAALAIDPTYVDAVLGMVRVTQTPAREAEHAEWVTKAAKLAPRNRYLRQRSLAVRARQTADRDELAKLLAECEQLLDIAPPSQELSLRVIRADLLERTGQIKQAEEDLRWVYQKSGDPLAAATLLVGFLVRTDQTAEADTVMADLLKRTDDKVGAYVLYGLALSLHSPAQAQRAFAKALSVNPKDPRVHLALSRHYSRQGQWPKAADALARHVELTGKGIEAQKELVLLRVEAGQYALAAKRLAAVLAKAPNDPGALTLRGFLLRKDGKDNEARQHFTRAIAIKKDYALPYVLRAQVHLDEGRAQPAREDLQTARRLRVQDPAVQLQIAMAYQRLGDLTTTEAQLTDLLRQHPNHLPAVRTLVSLYTMQKQWYKLEPLLAGARRAFPRDISFLLAEADLHAARREGAQQLRALARAYELAPRSDVVLRAYVEALLETGKGDEAQKVARTVVDDPQIGPWARGVVARALAAQDRHDQAKKAFADALALTPPARVGQVAVQMKAAWGLARAADEAGQWLADRGDDWRAALLSGELETQRMADGSADALGKATSAYGAAAAKAPDAASKAVAYRGLARTMSLAGKPREAAEAYRSSLACQDDDLATLNNLAYVLTNDLNKADQALPYAQRVFALAGGDANVLDTYGWTLAKLGRYGEARERLQQAVLRGQPSPSRRYHLGWVLEHMPQPELAQAHKQYTQALASLDSSKGDAALSREVRASLARVRKKMARRID